MTNQRDVEDIILCMAEIVMDNRALRKRNEELEIENKELCRAISKNAKSSEEETKNMLGMLLKKTLLDAEKSIRHARCEWCGDTGAELIESWQRYQVVCPNCGCATKEMKDVFSAVNAWEEGEIYAPKHEDE